jgi:cytidine deaminase
LASNLAKIKNQKIKKSKRSPPMDIDWTRLLHAASQARQHSYAPYSAFRVGAAVLTADGTLYAGCNIENASYGATCCAERVALFQAVSAGQQARSFRALVVTAATAQPISPCGMCRQVLVELCPPDMPICMANEAGASRIVTVEQLLPFSFDGETLLSQQSEEPKREF